VVRGFFIPGGGCCFKFALAVNSQPGLDPFSVAFSKSSRGPSCSASAVATGLDDAPALDWFSSSTSPLGRNPRNRCCRCRFRSSAQQPMSDEGKENLQSGWGCSFSRPHSSRGLPTQWHLLGPAHPDQHRSMKLPGSGKN